MPAGECVWHQKEDRTVPTWLCPHSQRALTGRPADSLGPSSPSSFPRLLGVCLSPSLFLLLQRPLFSLPPFFFLAPSSCFLAIQRKEGRCFCSWASVSREVSGNTTGPGEASERARLTELSVPLPAVRVVPADGLCLHFCFSASATLSLSLGLCVFLYFSLYPSLPLALYVYVGVPFAVCVPSWEVSPLSSRKTFWCKRRGERPQTLCAWSCLGIRLRTVSAN